jgi:hypothetical protein
MAKLNFFLVLVASICTITIASTKDSLINYLHQCANHMGEDCGKQVYNKMFTSNTTTISNDCCYKLFQTGYYCHTKMTLFILETDPKYKNEEWINYLTNGDKIYDTCDLVTRPENTTVLTTCVEQIGSHCGKEIIDSIINEEDVSKKCCEKLVKMGEKCHTNMAKSMIRTPEMRKVDALKFLERSKLVFDQCKSIA